MELNHKLIDARFDSTYFNPFSALETRNQVSALDSIQEADQLGVHTRAASRALSVVDS